MGDVRQVSLEPVNGAYGFVLVGNAPVYIQSLEPGGAADVAGACVGDRILGVNGVKVIDCKHTQVISLIRKARAPVRLVVAATAATSPEELPEELLANPLIAALTVIPKIGGTATTRRPTLRAVTEFNFRLCGIEKVVKPKEGWDVDQLKSALLHVEITDPQADKPCVLLVTPEKLTFNSTSGESMGTFSLSSIDFCASVTHPSALTTFLLVAHDVQLTHWCYVFHGDDAETLSSLLRDLRQSRRRSTEPQLNEQARVTARSRVGAGSQIELVSMHSDGAMPSPTKARKGSLAGRSASMSAGSTLAEETSDALTEEEPSVPQPPPPTPQRDNDPGPDANNGNGASRSSVQQASRILKAPPLGRRSSEERIASVSQASSAKSLIPVRKTGTGASPLKTGASPQHRATRGSYSLAVTGPNSRIEMSLPDLSPEPATSPLPTPTSAGVFSPSPSEQDPDVAALNATLRKPESAAALDITDFGDDEGVDSPVQAAPETPTNHHPHSTSILQGSLTPVRTPDVNASPTKRASYHRRSSSDSFILATALAAAASSPLPNKRIPSPPAYINQSSLLHDTAATPEDAVHVLPRPPIDPVKDLQLLDVLDALDYVIALPQVTTDPASFTEIVPGLSLGKGRFMNFAVVVSKFEHTPIPRFPEQVEAVEPCLLEVAENLNEARRLSSHENLVIFLGITFVTRELGGLDVMVFSDAGDTQFSLAAIIHGETPIEPPKTSAEQLSVCVGIANGITHLHDHKIVHGALTPFQVRMGADNCPKITDLALSPLFYYLPDSALQLRRYWSPETLLDPTSTTTASDVYSLSLIFFEIFHRQRPYVDCATPQQLVRHVVHQCARPEVSSLLMAGVKSLLTQCWAVDVAARPPSNRVFIQLMSLLDDDLSDDDSEAEVALTRELARRRSLRQAPEFEAMQWPERNVSAIAAAAIQKSNDSIAAAAATNTANAPAAAAAAAAATAAAAAAAPSAANSGASTSAGPGSRQGSRTIFRVPPPPISAPADRGGSMPSLLAHNTIPEHRQGGGASFETLAQRIQNMVHGSNDSLNAELEQAEELDEEGTLRRRRSFSANHLNDRPLTPSRHPPAYPSAEVLPLMRPTTDFSAELLHEWSARERAIVGSMPWKSTASRPSGASSTHTTVSTPTDSSATTPLSEFPSNASAAAAAAAAAPKPAGSAPATRQPSGSSDEPAPAVTTVDSHANNPPPEKAEPEEDDFFAMLQKHQTKKADTSMSWTVQDAIDAAIVEGEPRDVDDPESWAIKFERLLPSQPGMQAFIEYSRTTYCEENAIFWLDCDQLRTCEEGMVPELCHKLFAKFFSGTRSLNIEFGNNKKIVSSYQANSLTRDLFAPAQKEVFTLMKFDTYPRFLKSQHFKDALSRWKRSKRKAAAAKDDAKGKKKTGPKAAQQPAAKAASGGAASSSGAAQGAGTETKGAAGEIKSEGKKLGWLFRVGTKRGKGDKAASGSSSGGSSGGEKGGKQAAPSVDIIVSGTDDDQVSSDLAAHEDEPRKRGVFSSLMRSNKDKGSKRMLGAAGASPAASPKSPRSTRTHTSPADMHTARAAAVQGSRPPPPVHSRSLEIVGEQDQQDGSAPDLYSSGDSDSADMFAEEGRVAEHEAEAAEAEFVLFRVSLPDHMHNSVVQAERGATLRTALAKVIQKFQLDPNTYRVSLRGHSDVLDWSAVASTVHQKEIELRRLPQLTVTVQGMADQNIMVHPDETVFELLEGFCAARGNDIDNYTAFVVHENEERFLNMDRMATDFVGRHILLALRKTPHQHAVALSPLTQDASVDSSISFV